MSSVSGNSEIYTVAANGSDERNHTDNPARDEDPAFSPDGSKIAFFSTRCGPAAIYTMNLNGTNVVQLTTDPAGDINPSFSPDGSRIAFTSFRDGNAEIYTMNVDGTDQRRLTSNAAADSKPIFSPNGSKIAFMSFRDSPRNPPQPEIYIMNPDGSGQTRLTITDGNAVPSFSPDGSKIVFSSVRDSSPAGAANYEIYIMNPDGSMQTRLTTDTSNIVDIDPAFSPDGSKIAFASTRDNRQPQIYTMNPDGSSVTPVTSSPGSKVGTEWGVASSAPLPPPGLQSPSPCANGLAAGGTVTSGSATPTIGASDRTAPGVSRYGLTNNPFAVGGRTPVFGSAAAKKTTKKHKKGTTFRYTLSEKATVSITIFQRRAGRRRGKRCVAPTRRLRRARKCTRITNRGRLTRTSHQGGNRVGFSGRIGSRALSPGSYLATLVATDAAKNRSKPKTIAFTVVKR